MTWPDTEGAVRTYLRAYTPLQAEWGQRVWFGTPKVVDEDDFPHAVVFRAGGGQDPGESPVDLAVVQVDVWGSLDASGNGLKADCTRVTGKVQDALELLRTRTNVTLPGGSVVALFGAVVESVIWLPDPDNDRPRYAVTSQVTAMAA